ncbi:hypothetical protein QVD17_07112 [Tagetes erecta]|uniref:Ubiquitin-like protease family profile domain-containing protein n=1 Tax=Tagetes erecta TaxID=13708 RepID=A0AAD8LH70_TARER|nr:hypothetical protein QVD17_07112 [Tagetes erecta]
MQEPKPLDPEYFGLTYKFPDGSQFYFGPHEYCLLTGFSFGNNESILEELWKNTDCVKFKESVIDTYINSEPTVTELYDFINSNSQMLQDDEKLPGSAFSPRRLLPTDDEKNEVWWIDSCAYIQEMYDLKVKSTGQNVGGSKDDDSPQKNFEFDKGYLDREAKSFMKTSLQRQDEIYQTLLDISSNSKLEEPRRRKSKRQRFPSIYYVTPFRPLENTPRIEKQKNKNSIVDSELEELCGRSYYWIWSTLLPHYAIDSEFWRVLLGNWQMDYGSGSYAPLPSIEYITTWLLANGSEAYNSYRQPPFVRVVPTFVPQQSGLLGDCGVWVCIFLDRRIEGEPFFQEQEDTAISAMNFRLQLERLILETKFKEEEKRNNDRGD